MSLRIAAVAAAVWFCGCGAEAPRPEEPQPLGSLRNSTDAGALESNRSPRHDVAEALRAERDVVHHPSDGGGRAWIVDPRRHRAGDRDRFELIYEAGPLGVTEGGTVFLQISPFWGWSTPQVDDVNGAGYTRVEFQPKGGGAGAEPADAPTLNARTADRQLLAVQIEGRPLRAGERLRFFYGAGPAAAAVDTYAETAEHVFIAVDGDGDGYRKLIDAPPTVDLAAGEPAQVVALLPSTARPGEAVRLHLSVLDRHGNAGVDFEGDFTLAVYAPEAADPVDDLGLGESLRGGLRFERGHRGHRTLELRPRRPGVLRLAVEGPAGLTALSNPLQVSERGRSIYWGDLQNHSNFSDGTALPEELYDYARDIAALDIMSVTDHDHWGLRFLDRRPDLWRHIQDVTERSHEPGRFVTIRGFEWTHWVYGHRHVLLFDDRPFDILSSVDDAYDHPTELWSALADRRALTIAHHSAGGPVSTDWSIAPPGDLEPVTEVVSVHGSSEAADSPKLIYRPVAGNFVRDAALGRGYRLGFIGSSDGHDGHPGLGHLASGTGGLAAILADELSRDGVYDALRARRTYATSGVRIVLRTLFGGYQMGTEVPVEGGAPVRTDAVDVSALPPDQLFIQALAPSALERLDVIRGADVVGSLDCRGLLECSTATPVGDLRAGEFLYVRAVQRDGHFAVSSPFFFVEP
ncbi:MAG: DUF3604 domain-containing protein [Acidobacteriota bacterium]